MANVTKIILTGKSCSGKDTVAKLITERMGYTKSVSLTSRPKRAGEVDGVDYEFISPLVDAEQLFRDKLKYGILINVREYLTFVGLTPAVWYYGTPAKPKRTMELFIADPEGAREIMDYHGADRCIVYYISGVSDDTRRARCIARGDFDEHEWNRRLLDDARVFNSETLDALEAISISASEGSEEAYKVIEATQKHIQRIKRFSM